MLASLADSSDGQARLENPRSLRSSSHIQEPSHVARRWPFSLRFKSCVNESPARWKLACVVRLLDWIVLLHMIIPIRQGVEPAIMNAILVSRKLLFIGVITSNPIDVASKSAAGRTSNALAAFVSQKTARIIDGNLQRTWRTSSQKRFDSLWPPTDLSYLSHRAQYCERKSQALLANERKRWSHHRNWY
jgi:hypothetical protein